jgi:hypothetical protein
MLLLVLQIMPFLFENHLHHLHHHHYWYQLHHPQQQDNLLLLHQLVLSMIVNLRILEMFDMNSNFLAAIYQQV